MKETERLNGIYERLLDGSGVTSYVGAGKLLDNHTVEITGQEVREVFFSKRVRVENEYRAQRKA